MIPAGPKVAQFRCGPSPGPSLNLLAEAPPLRWSPERALVQKSEYLSQAENCRSRALKATSEWRRKQLLELAEQWEKLGAGDHGGEIAKPDFSQST